MAAVSNPFRIAMTTFGAPGSPGSAHSNHPHSKTPSMTVTCWTMIQESASSAVWICPSGRSRSGATDHSKLITVQPPSAIPATLGPDHRLRRRQHLPTMPAVNLQEVAPEETDRLFHSTNPNFARKNFDMDRNFSVRFRFTSSRCSASVTRKVSCTPRTSSGSSSASVKVLGLGMS